MTYPDSAETLHAGVLRPALAVLLTVCLLAAVALIGCSSEGGQPEGSQPAGTDGTGEPVTVVLDWTPNTNHTGIYVALAKGYFAEEGLDVTVVQPPDNGAEALVASGKAQFGISFQDTMAPAITKESALPITAVAALVQHNTSGIISRAGEGMDRPSGMAGHTYATWDLPVEKATIEEVVEADGGSFDDVVLVPSTVTDEVSALKSKSVDAIWVFYAWGGIACEVAGLDTDYFAFADIDPVFDYYTPVVIANNSFLKNDPDTAKRFLAALARGYEDAAADPDGAAELLIQQVPELAGSRELVVASQRYLADRYIDDAAAWGVFDPARWQAFYAWLNDNQLVEGTLDPASGFTNDYLPSSN